MLSIQRWMSFLRIHFRCFACTPSKTPKNHPFAKEHHLNQTSILHDVGFPAIRMIGSVFVQPGFVRAFKRARNPTEASIYGSNTPILKSRGSRQGRRERKGLFFLEDHPRTWIRGWDHPPFKSHLKPIWKGNNPILRGQQLIMVINHSLNGMILQVGIPSLGFHFPSLLKKSMLEYFWVWRCEWNIFKTFSMWCVLVGPNKCIYSQGS